MRALAFYPRLAHARGVDFLGSDFAQLERWTFRALLTAFAALEFLSLLSVPSVLLRRRGRPQSALAWLLALIAFPGLGAVAWWAFGRTRLERRLRSHIGARKQFVEQHGPATTTAEKTLYDALLPARARGEYAFATTSNRATLLTTGTSAFEEMHQAIRSAQECVHLLFYIFEDDETGARMCAALEERARAGVQVKVLLDGFGSQKSAAKIKARLRPHGAAVEVFLPNRLRPLYAPRFNFINHRKILTIDNRVGFTGGMNIGAEYEHEWKDLMLKIEGPAVDGLNHILLEDWYFATGTALSDPTPRPPGGSGETHVGVVAAGPDSEPWIHDAYFLAINQAKERLYLATPYFIPTPAILTSLRTAAGRGVDVRLVLPALSDVRLVMWASRSFYAELVRSGVKIYEYSAAMLHAKALLKDDHLISVGTANIDNRSFRLSFEVCCFASSPALTAQLSDWMLDLFRNSTEITLPGLAKKSTPHKLVESAAHLLSPLL